MTTTDRKPIEPLATVTGVFGMLILVLIALLVIVSVAGSGSFGGFGHATVCATQPGFSDGGSPATHFGFSAQPGASLSIQGTLQACAQHPTFYQRLMYTFMGVPTLLLWVAVLFLLWRLVTAASKSGPFTLLVAARMRWLGWVVLVGAVAANAVQGAATDALLNTLLRPQNDFGQAVPLPQILPVPLLVWAGLLTFARIIRVGVDMDDDLQGTV